MHPADVVAAVKKRGTNLVQLSLSNGLSRSAIQVALVMPSLRAEKALIDFLKIPPQRIWPDRYDANGERTVLRGKPSHRNYKPTPARAKGQS